MRLKLKRPSSQPAQPLMDVSRVLHRLEEAKVVFNYLAMAAITNASHGLFGEVADAPGTFLVPFPRRSSRFVVDDRRPPAKVLANAA